MAAAKKRTTKKTGFEDMAGVNTASIQEGFEKINKGFEQVAEFQKESMDAIISASTTVTSSLEQLSAEQADFAKANFEENVKTAQSLASCKTPQEALDLNAEFFRTSFEKNIAQFNKITEMMVTSSKTAAEPITDNYNQLVEKVQSFRP